MTKVKVKLRKPVTAQCLEKLEWCTCCSAVTTLCQSQCGVAEICAILIT